MKFICYKIINLINGKIYIGCHKTENVKDDYMGSGKIIKKAINKYGIKNFKKEVLSIFDSEHQMFNEEKNLISKLKPDYNITNGGNGGWEHINNSSKHSKFVKMGGDSLANKMKTDKEFREKNIIKIQTGLKGYYKTHHGWFLGKHHSIKTKIKIGIANSINMRGDKNSQYGTMWITNGINNKKIKKDENIPNNWKKGRIMGL